MSTSRTLTPMRQAESDRPAGIHDHDRPLSDYSLLGGASAGTWLRATLPDIDEVLSHRPHGPAGATDVGGRGCARLTAPTRGRDRRWAGADVPASPHRRAGATDGGRARVCQPHRTDARARQTVGGRGCASLGQVGTPDPSEASPGDIVSKMVGTALPVQTLLPGRPRSVPNVAMELAGRSSDDVAGTAVSTRFPTASAVLRWNGDWSQLQFEMTMLTAFHVPRSRP